MTFNDVEDLAFEILKQVMEEKVGNQNIEVASLTSAGYHVYSTDELDAVIRRML